MISKTIRLLCLALLPLALVACLEDAEDPRPDRSSPIPDGSLFDPGPRPSGGGYGSGSGSGSGTSTGSGALRAADAGLDAQIAG
jgi:hypothetical protein